MLRVAATAGLVLMLACQPAAPPEDASNAGTANGPALGTAEWKIQAYSSAAPAAIAAGATVLDWNDSLTATSVTLREGSNGWTCLPLVPPPVGGGGYTEAVQAAPMCLDPMALAWAQGYMTRTAPGNQGMGLAYMLQGDLGASNTDPYGMTQTADNDWVVTGPHIMIFPAEAARLAGMSTDHRTGGPYVMWQGTQYAHIMMPVGETP